MIKPNRERWGELAASVLFVLLIGSIGPTDRFDELIHTVAFAIVWLAAVGLVRNTGPLRLPSRAVFWSWFCLVSVVLLLSVWNMASHLCFPPPGGRM